MTINEYFGEWLKVINERELMKIIKWLKLQPSSTLCPNHNDVFKAFKLCSYKDCKAIFIGQYPYNQKGIATGIAFGNSQQTKEKDLSPSLRVIKNSVINFEVPHSLFTFDHSLYSWAKQGILMLNTALTTEVGKTEVHISQWRPFIISFLRNMSERNPGMIYVLFGTQAAILEPYIKDKNYVIKERHPSYYVRNRKPMPSELWDNINNLIYSLYGEKIEWYKED